MFRKRWTSVYRGSWPGKWPQNPQKFGFGKIEISFWNPLSIGSNPHLEPGWERSLDSLRNQAIALIDPSMSVIDSMTMSAP